MHATPTRPVTFAMAVTGRDIAAVGPEVARAGDLLTRAVFWWAGDPEILAQRTADLGLQEPGRAPEEDELMLLAFEAELSEQERLGSRMGAAEVLRREGQAGGLRPGTFCSITRPGALRSAGFRR